MSESRRVELPDLESLQQEAADFVSALTPGPSATLVTLSGELGAGKTSFTQGMAHALGVTDAVTSPTFVLQKTYPLEEQEFARLIHVDAYRLKGAEELRPLGFAETLADPANLIALEWPERVADALPAPTCALSFEVLSAGRAVTYRYA